MRQELVKKIEYLDRRITESKNDLSAKIAELKSDSKDDRRDLKESFKNEIQHLKTEILAALPVRARGAEHNH
ncbi:MAG: hypothetical protein WA324_28965 [Bryobacteraceae bacterium]